MAKANPLAEWRLLGLMRLDQHSALPTKIKPDLFTEDRQEVFKAIKRAYAKYGNASVESIESYGIGFPSELDIEYSGDPAPIIDELARLYKKRKLDEIAQLCKLRADSHDPDITDIIGALSDAAFIREEDSSLTEGISAFTQELHAKMSGSYRWLKTGVPFLDNMLGGEWYRGELTVITGNTGGGKSALVNTSSLNMARLYRDAKESSPSAIFSMEMPKSQIVLRFVSAITGIDSSAIKAGRFYDRSLNEYERNAINDAIRELQELPIYIFDTPSMDAPWIIAQSRELINKCGVECIFIDYLQLMKYEGDNKHYGLSNAGKMIRQFAKEQNIAAVALGQIHDDGRLRDVGDTDRDAGAIIRLSVDFENVDDNGICPVNLDISKNRHGRTGKYTGLFDTKHVRFL